MVAFALETWPPELAGLVDWDLLGTSLGRHPKHAPRALTAAVLMLMTLELTQPEVYARVRAFMNRRLGERRAELAELQIAEMLRARGGLGED